VSEDLVYIMSLMEKVDGGENSSTVLVCQNLQNKRDFKSFSPAPFFRENGIWTGPFKDPRQVLINRAMLYRVFTKLCATG